MSQPRDCHVRVEKAQLSVPVMGDPARTHKLAEELTKRIERINLERGAVNSLHSALHAALELAHENDELRREHHWENQEVVRVLNDLLKKVRALITLYKPQNTDEEE